MALTALGATLADGVPGSVRNLALMLMETQYAPFARLVDTMRTGVPAGTVHYGRPFFDWLAGHPEQVTQFTVAMADYTYSLRRDTLAGYRLPTGQTVADIGGADGALLAELLAADPDQSRRGIVFDLPRVVSAAPALLAERGLGARVRAQGGDFFDALPAADVYVLSSILHDWDDDAGARILSGIATAAAPGAHLVIIEMVIPPGDQRHAAQSLDLTMLGTVTGKERTRAEFETLLTDAGFTLERVLPDSAGSPTASSKRSSSDVNQARFRTPLRRQPRCCETAFRPAPSSPSRRRSSLRLGYGNAQVQSHPAMLVRCRTTAQVQAARKTSLPLSVRGGGHDWPGRAVRDGALVIDLSGMRTFGWAQARSVLSGLRGLHGELDDALDVMFGAIRTPDGPVLFTTPVWAGSAEAGLAQISRVRSLGDAVIDDVARRPLVDVVRAAGEPFPYGGNYWLGSRIAPALPALDDAFVDAFVQCAFAERIPLVRA